MPTIARIGSIQIRIYYDDHGVIRAPGACADAIWRRSAPCNARDGQPLQDIENRMPYRVANAVAHPNHIVTVTWSDGVTADVDLSPVVAAGHVFAPLQQAGYFVSEMRIATDCLGLEWRDRVDISADGLRFRAFPQ